MAGASLRLSHRQKAPLTKFQRKDSKTLATRCPGENMHAATAIFRRHRAAAPRSARPVSPCPAPPPTEPLRLQHACRKPAIFAGSARQLIVPPRECEEEQPYLAVRSGTAGATSSRRPLTPSSVSAWPSTRIRCETPSCLRSAHGTRSDRWEAEGWLRGVLH